MFTCPTKKALTYSKPCCTETMKAKQSFFIRDAVDVKVCSFFELPTAGSAAPVVGLWVFDGVGDDLISIKIENPPSSFCFAGEKEWGRKARDVLDFGSFRVRHVWWLCAELCCAWQLYNLPTFRFILWVMEICGSGLLFWTDFY